MVVTADIARKEADERRWSDTQKEARPDGLAEYATMPGPSGKASLLELIHQLRWKAEVYQALYNALPERLTSDQSAGLNVLISNQK